MMGSTRTVSVWTYPAPADLRKGFDSLAGLVASELQRDRIAGHPGYVVLALDVEQAVEFGALPTIRHPMDRMIVAAARVTGSRLVSSDEALSEHGVEVVWD